MDEILSMNVGGKHNGANRQLQQRQQQPQSASSGLPAVDSSSAASRAATQGSSPAPSTAVLQHSPGAAAMAPPLPVPMPASMPADNSVHALVYSSPVPNHQGAVMPQGFPQSMHSMIAQPAVVSAGATMLPPQASMPLQQYVPGQLFAQDGVQMGMQGLGGPPAPSIVTPTSEAPPQPASRFDSQIAAAEAAAANLAKAMAAKPAAARGGRAGAGRRGAARVRR
jgi:hypothetical protein